MSQVGMNPIQWGTFSLVLVLVLLSTFLMRIDKDYRGLYFAYLAWFLHQALFYLAYALYPPFLQGSFTEWSAAVRAHGYLLLISTFVYRIFRYGIKRR